MLYLLSALTLLSSALAATTCNGHAELCDKLYSNVTFIGAHNSYAVGSSVADNQSKNVTSQLVGTDLSMLMIGRWHPHPANPNVSDRYEQADDSHDSDGDIHVCHSSCVSPRLARS
jgi:hypothetical protein